MINRLLLMLFLVCTASAYSMDEKMQKWHADVEIHRTTCLLAQDESTAQELHDWLTTKGSPNPIVKNSRFVHGPVGAAAKANNLAGIKILLTDKRCNLKWLSADLLADTFTYAYFQVNRFSQNDYKAYVAKALTIIRLLLFCGLQPDEETKNEAQSIAQFGDSWIGAVDLCTKFKKHIDHHERIADLLEEGELEEFSAIQLKHFDVSYASLIHRQVGSHYAQVMTRNAQRLKAQKKSVNKETGGSAGLPAVANLSALNGKNGK